MYSLNLHTVSTHNIQIHSRCASLFDLALHWFSLSNPSPLWQARFIFHLTGDWATATTEYSLTSCTLCQLITSKLIQVVRAILIWPCIYTSKLICIVRATCMWPCFPLRYGQGRTRKRTPGSGTKGKTKGSGKGKGDAAAWSMAMSAVSDLASVARSVLEGQKSKWRKTWCNWGRF